LQQQRSREAPAPQTRLSPTVATWRRAVIAQSHQFRPHD